MVGNGIGMFIVVHRVRIYFQKEKYNEILNLCSSNYFYNLDGRHILLKVLDDLILVDSIEKKFYNTGNKYELLFNSFIDTFMDDGLDYIYIQNGKYNWKDKKKHLDFSNTNNENEKFEKNLKEDDSIYILPLTKLVRHMKLNSARLTLIQMLHSAAQRSSLLTA